MIALRFRPSLHAVLLALCAGAAGAHERQAGDIVFEHPYAVPSAPGASSAGVYFRAIRHRGSVPERIVAARSPAAVEVRLAGAPAGMVLAPGAEIRPRHDRPALFTLIGLNRPLKAGDSFALTLTLERAGSSSFTVTVVQPKAPARAGKAPS